MDKVEYPSLEFFRQIYWREAVLEFEVERELRTGGFPGTSLRGALGDFLRVALCEETPACARDCRKPAACRYVQLFEGRGAGPGADSDGPRPYVLRPPELPRLAAIGAGGPVLKPYEEGRAFKAGGLRTLRNDDKFVVPEGGRVRFSLAVFGPMGAVLVPLIDALREGGLTWAGVPCRLIRATDGQAWNRVLFDRSLPVAPVREPVRQSLQGPLQDPAEQVHRLRVVLETPVLIKSGSRALVNVGGFWKSFFEQCLMRAMRMHDNFCRVGPGRLPWASVPVENLWLADSRLFHYVLPRRSYRQGGRDMEFDGLVGYMDFQGEDLSWYLALARAAEILHVGQKTTFGYGRVACSTC